jgi:hypothetical protein
MSTWIEYSLPPGERDDVADDVDAGRTRDELTAADITAGRVGVAKARAALRSVEPRDAE